MERLGDCTLVHVTLDGIEPLVSVKRFDQDLQWRPGTRVDLRPRMDACLLFREDGGLIEGGSGPGPERTAP